MHRNYRLHVDSLKASDIIQMLSFTDMNKISPYWVWEVNDYVDSE